MTTTQKLWLVTTCIWIVNVLLNVAEGDWDAALNAFGAAFCAAVLVWTVGKKAGA